MGTDIGDVCLYVRSFLMKNVKKNIIVQAMLVALVTFVTLAAFVALIACSNPAEDTTGTITISLSGAANGSNADGNARAAAWPPNDATKGKLVHKIILTGPGATQTHEINGGTTALAFTVTPGTWTVTVEARLDGELYATGSKTVTINAGQNERVQIVMSHAGYTITMTSNDDDWGVAAANPPKAVKDETITITATSRVGYRLKEWQVVSGGVSLSSTKTASATFTMPDNDVAIKAVFELIPVNTPSLELSAVVFDGITYGEALPAAKTVTITNNGDVAAAVSSIALSGANASSFSLTESITSVAPNGGTAAFTVQPNAVNAGEYIAVINVKYSGGEISAASPATAEADLTFLVEKATPTASQYDISGTENQTAGSVTAWTVTAKTGGVLVSPGIVTVKYNGSTTLPQTAGTYPVTFDVAAAPNWNAASGLHAGTLNVTTVSTYTPGEVVGDGSLGDPFIVHDNTTLRAVGTATGDYTAWTLSAHYLQDRNITLTGGDWTPIGPSTNANSFTGTYDGGGHEIRNLTINGSAMYQGMFGVIGTGGEVKNVALVNVNINNTSTYTGSVAGQISRGKITNCSVTGTITGTTDIGGVVGRIYSGTITNCYSGATIIATGEAVGGVVGGNIGTVVNCYSTGNVTGGLYVGGVVGENNGAFESSVTVTNCYSTGNITGNGYVGGVVGKNTADLDSVTVTNCYSTGEVTGDAYDGGVVGYIFGDKSSVLNSVALNKKITKSNNQPDMIGRVIGNVSNNPTMTNLYGRSIGITITDNGTPYTPTSDAGGKDGADITSDDWNSATWWQDIAQFPSDAWEFRAGLPTLKNMPGNPVQNPTVQ